MKRIRCIMSYFLLLTLLPFIISIFMGFDLECTQEHWLYDDIFNSKGCKETGYVYLDSFIRKADKKVDICLEWTLNLLDNFAKLFSLAFNTIFNLFYVKEETLSDKIHSFFKPILTQVQPQKTLKLCSILVPYVYFGPNGIVINTTTWRPTCLTAFLTKIAIILLNPVIGLTAGLLFLILDNIYRPIRRKYQKKNNYLDMEQIKLKRQLYY